jgi:hypothetical protein
MTPSASTGARIRDAALVLLIAGGTVLFIGALMDQLIGEGPFGYHASRPQSWQGGLEVVAIAVLLAAAAGLVRTPRRRAVLVLVIAGGYLRRHFVDIPMLIDLAYVEILVGLGAGASRVAGFAPARDARDYLRFFIAGVVLWSVGAWTLSAFGVGSLKILRLYTLVLAIPAAAARETPLALFLWRKFAASTPPERATIAALGAWFLALAARTNVVGGFDPWWYGFRGEYVLVPGRSVFEPLGLVAPVHYYPKLYELLLISVSGLHDTSVIEGIAIFVLLLFALASMELLKPLGLGVRTRVLLVALVTTVPAIANSALSPKPDLFMAFVLLVACIEATRFAREGSSSAGFWIVTSMLIAFASKLSAPPFLVAVALGSLALGVLNGRPRTPDPAGERRFAIAIAGAAAIVGVFVTARTWLLAGVPMVAPEPMLALFEKFGMTLKPPVGRLLSAPAIGLDAQPGLLIDQLFRPQRLDHMVVTWIGNVWLFLFALAAAARVLVRRGRDDAPRVPAIWWIVQLAGLVLLLTFETTTRGGEGNYLVLPVALAMLAGGYVALRALPPGMPVRLLLAMLPLFAVSQAWYSFLSAGWGTGTRAFDVNFGHSTRDLRKQKLRIFEQAGIANIANYIDAVPGVPRGVGYVTDGALFRLDGTFEALNMYGFWNRAPLENAQAFVDYLAANRLDYLILPTERNAKMRPNVVASVAEAAATLRADPGVRIVEDSNYVLYDLAALHAADRAGR